MVQAGGQSFLGIHTLPAGERLYIPKKGENAELLHISAGVLHDKRMSKKLIEIRGTVASNQMSRSYLPDKTFRA